MRKFPGQHLSPTFVIFPGATRMPEESEKVLTFEVERDGDTAIVKCHGRLVVGTTQELYQEVKDLLPQAKVVVVDLAELTYVDSSGLGTQLRNLLKLTNLLSVFSQVEDHGINIA